MENNEEQKIYKVHEKVDSSGDNIIKIDQKRIGRYHENYPYDIGDKYTLDLGEDYNKFSLEYNRERKQWIVNMDYHSVPDFDGYDKSSFTMKINDKNLARVLGIEKGANLQTNICLSSDDDFSVIGNDFNIIMRYMLALDYFMSTAYKTIYGVDSPKKIKQNPVGDRIYNDIITAFSNKIKSFFSENGVENLANAEDAQQFLDNQFKEHDLPSPLYSINQVQKSIVEPYFEKMQAKRQRQEKLDEIIKSSISEQKNPQSFLANVFTYLAAKLKNYHKYALVRSEVTKLLKDQGIKMPRSKVQQAVQDALGRDR